MVTYNKIIKKQMSKQQQNVIKNNSIWFFDEIATVLIAVDIR